MVDFILSNCYHKFSYTTDGFSGIDHGEYSGRADRLGMNTPGCAAFFIFRRRPFWQPERIGTMKTTKTASRNWRNNKWICGAIPALLIHCSIGTVYCWSIFSQEIADYIGFSKAATE